MTPLEYVYLGSMMLGGGYLALASILHVIAGDHGGDGDAGGFDGDVDAGGLDADLDAGGLDADLDAGGLDADLDAGGFDADLDGGGFDADLDGAALDLDHGGLDLDHGAPDASHAGVADGGALAQHDPNLARDLPGSSHDVSFFSPLVLSTLLFAFGVMGFVVDHWLTGVALIGLGAAIGSAAIGGGGVWWGLNRLRRVEGSSETRVRTLLGHVAQVSVAIPDRGFGEIVYVHNQSRCNAPARSREGVPIPRGARVLIGGIDGSTFLVEEARADRIRRLARAEADPPDGDGDDPADDGGRATRNKQRQPG